MCDSAAACNGGLTFGTRKPLDFKGSVFRPETYPLPDLDEARDVLRAGLETSPWVSVDDTGARHKAKKAFAPRLAMTGSPGSPRAHQRPG